MWRWVTRGLVLSLVTLFASALLAQTFDFTGAVDSPDPERPQSGLVLVQGWVLSPIVVNRIELWVDDTKQHNAIMFLPRIDIERAYPDWPGIHNASPFASVCTFASSARELGFCGNRPTCPSI